MIELLFFQYNFCLSNVIAFTPSPRRSGSTLGLLLFSCSVVYDSLWPYGLQHARFPCPLPSPWACLNSCPLRQWCHPTTSSSVMPFSSCLPSPPAFLTFGLGSWKCSSTSVIRCIAVSLNVCVCVCVCVYVLTPQSYLTLCNPMDCSPLGSSVHGIFQARTLEWVTIPFFRGSSIHKDTNQVSCNAGGLFTVEPLGKPL